MNITKGTGGTHITALITDLTILDHTTFLGHTTFPEATTHLDTTDQKFTTSVIVVEPTIEEPITTVHAVTIADKIYLKPRFFR